MTTSNKIVTKIHKNVRFVPLEAIQNDSLTYVFKQTESGKVVKQEVITGEFNDDQIIVKYGLQKNETILLSIPENADELEIMVLTDEDQAAFEKEEADRQQKIKEQAVQAAAARKKEEERLKKIIQ